MTEGWHLPDDDVPLTGEQAAALIQQRLDRGLLETWLEHDRGLLLALVSNRTRALVMLLNEPGDAGAHAADPNTTGHQEGYILDNGQHDTYDNRDTITLGEALRTVKHIVDHGYPPAHITWQVDP
jgi:hypothetical protein